MTTHLLIVLVVMNTEASYLSRSCTNKEDSVVYIDLRWHTLLRDDPLVSEASQAVTLRGEEEVSHLHLVLGLMVPVSIVHEINQE